MRWPGTKPSAEFYNGSTQLRMEAMDMVNAVRKNHALEHATINLLLKRVDGRVRLVGRSGLTGFHIYGDVPTQALEESAREALRRLQDGEEGLAVSPMCGTNFVVGGLMAGVASMIAGRGHSGLSKFTRIVEASMIALLLAQPVGRLAQKHLTTTADVANLSILKVVKKGNGKLTRHKVEIVHL